MILTFDQSLGQLVWDLLVKGWERTWRWPYTVKSSDQQLLKDDISTNLPFLLNLDILFGSGLDGSTVGFSVI